MGWSFKQWNISLSFKHIDFFLLDKFITYFLISKQIDFLCTVENNYAQLRPNKVAHFYLKDNMYPHNDMEDYLYYQPILYETCLVLIKPAERGSGSSYDYQQRALIGYWELKEWCKVKTYNYFNYIKI